MSFKMSVLVSQRWLENVQMVPKMTRIAEGLKFSQTCLAAIAATRRNVKVIHTKSTKLTWFAEMHSPNILLG